MKESKLPTAYQSLSNHLSRVVITLDTAHESILTDAIRRPLGIQEARELVNQMLDEEISFSRFVELINEGGKL